jgi:hypothetical protein
VLRNRNRPELAIVLLLETNEITRWCDDCHTQSVPVALLSFRDRGRGRLFGGFNIDGLSLRRRSHRVGQVFVWIIWIGRYLRKDSRTHQYRGAEGARYNQTKHLCYLPPK